MTAALPEYLAIPADALAVATGPELELYEAALRREAALLSPLDYAEYVTPWAERRNYTEVINRYILALTEHALYEYGIDLPAIRQEDPENPKNWWYAHPVTGERPVNIFVMSMPPRHGKSFLFSEHTPAWYLTKFPDRTVILASYEADFAADFGGKNRDKIEQHPELGVTIDSTTRAKGSWRLDGHRGGMQCAGAGGAIIGKSAYLFLMDDLVKNNEEALSVSDRQKKIDWWKSTAKTRLEPGGVAAYLGTRWHEGDIGGWLAENERCFSLNIPALAFEGNADPVDGVARHPDTGQRDPLNRKPGEALYPEGFPVSYLLEVMEKGDGEDTPGGMLWFSAAYQGVPNIQGKGIFSAPFHYYSCTKDQYSRLLFVMPDKSTVLSRDCLHFITVDLAATTKTTADYTVFASWAHTPDGRMLLTELWRERMESTDHENKLRVFHAMCTGIYGSIFTTGIESVTFGLSLVQSMLRNGGISVRPLTPDKDKVARAIPAGERARSGRMLLPEGRLFLKEYEKELLKFDKATHDDQVDVTAYAHVIAETLPIRTAKSATHPYTADEKAEAHFAATAAGMTKAAKRKRRAYGLR